MVVSSGGIRWRAADEGVSLFTRWPAARAQAAALVAPVHRASVAQPGDLPDGVHAHGGRALSPCGADGPERRGRRAVAALRRRHRARPALPEGRRAALYSALERAVPL